MGARPAGTFGLAFIDPVKAPTIIVNIIARLKGVRTGYFYALSLMAVADKPCAEPDKYHAQLTVY